MTFAKIKISSKETKKNGFVFQLMGLGMLMSFVLMVNLLTFQNKHSHVLDQSGEMPIIEKTFDQLDKNTSKFLVDFEPTIIKTTEVTAIQAD